MIALVPGVFGPGLCKCGCGQHSRIAPYTVRTRGWVRGEALFLRGHRLSAPAEARTCEQCHVVMARRRSPSGVIEAPCVYAQRRFCSTKCQIDARRSTAPSVQGGRRHAQRMFSAVGERCEDCGTAERLHRHHLDGNTAHNVRENIAFLCVVCHARRHGPEKVEIARAMTRRRLDQAAASV